MFKVTAIIILCSVVAVFGASFPSTLKRCRYNDSTCLIPTIQEYLKSGSSRGIPEINLLPMDPFLINELNIIQGRDSPVNVKLNFKDINLKGLSGIQISKVTGLDRDPTLNKIEIVAKAPKLALVGQYTIDGSVLILPIQGAGNSNIELTDTAIKLVLTAKNSHEKKGDQYIQITKMRLSIDPQKVQMNFANLFNGDKILGETTNRFLNENWKDIFDEIKPAIVEALELVLTNAVNQVFNKIPYNQAFIE